MGIFLRAFKSLFRTFPNVEKADYNDQVMNWTIIKHDMSYKEYKGRFKAIHKNFKYRFVFPLVLIGHKIIGKYLINAKDVANDDNNKIIRAWDESYELSIKEWCNIYRKNKNPLKPTDYTNDPSNEILRKMNDFLRTVYLHDTAYRAFFDIVSINWAIKIGEVYPKEIDHFIYNSKVIDDVDFKIITGKTQDNIIINCGDFFLAFKKGDGFRIEAVDMKSAYAEAKRLEEMPLPFKDDVKPTEEKQQ